MQSERSARSPWLMYALLLLACAAALLVLRALARHFIAHPAASAVAERTVAPQHHSLAHLLLSLLIVLATAHVLRAALERVGQPGVVGDIVAGLLLGPSLLGQVAPAAAEFLFPDQVAPLLSALSNVGVLVFMFLVGLELDLGAVKKRSHAAVMISHASIALPFVLGALLAFALHARLAPAGVRFELFALFMGAAMSVTAFPVLARILRETGLERTPIGALALICAAVDDVTAWCLLAVVTGLASASSFGAVYTIGLTLLFVLLAHFALKPVLHRFLAAQEARGQSLRAVMAIVLALMLGAALATEVIGIHAIFGAFLAGTLLPHGSQLARALREKLEDVVLVLLLPAFFAYTGLRTQLQLVHGVDGWLTCLLIVFVACLGKVGGAYIAGRLVGLSSRHSLTLGALLNTRGLMELVVLNIGLDLGVISRELFAMMVVMALVTTLTTAPALRMLNSKI